MSDRRGQPAIALFLPPVWPVTLACAAVVAMTAVTAGIGLDSPIVDRPAVFVTLRLLFCLGLVAIAVVMLARGPSDRMAALIVAAAGSLALAGLTAADSPVPFAVGRVAATLAVLLTAYVCFAYPDGHIETA